MFADDVQLPDGRQIDGFLRIDSRPYAVIFAVTADEQALFVEGYRYGPGRRCLQLPAGYLEDSEAPEACAQRELSEETGYVACDWEHLGTFCPDGNRGFGQAHFFLAQGAEARRALGPGEVEDLTLRRVPLDHVAGLLLRAEFGELTAVAGTGLALARLGQLAHTVARR